MLSSWIRKIFRSKRGSSEIFPDEVFLDSTNLPNFNQDQFEGRIEKPISKATYLMLVIFVAILFIGYGAKAFSLQIVDGERLRERSEKNRLQSSPIFAERGAIYDRNGVALAFNVPQTDETEFSGRRYASIDGISHIVGYVNTPKKDKNGNYFQNKFIGQAGAEKQFDEVLSGSNGKKIIETDASGAKTWESTIEPPKQGDNIYLSIDSRINNELYKDIRALVNERGFTGGAGAIMDIHTGELLAMTSYPEYDSNVITDGSDSQAIKNFFNNKSNPFLNRIVSGLYTPGSIVKPFIALAALNENIISPEKKILSTGSISVQNPYDPTKSSVFNDWKAHGLVDMRRAIAYSSNVYFYEIGGGYENQKGLGIDRIYKYLTSFGFGKTTGINLSGEEVGTVPNPTWKAEVFKDDPTWRLGDTYFTSIGQYGFQITPLQILRGIAFIANDGVLLSPSISKDKIEGIPEYYRMDRKYFQIIREGMRLGATEGTGSGLASLPIKIATKTGTAELGVSKEQVNSWAVGFFPYDNPKYAFTVMMEKGSRNNTVGSVYIIKNLLEWMVQNTPEYTK